MEPFEIRKSGGTGRGLFATRFIKKDEHILEFTGPVTDFKQSIQKAPEKQSYPLQIGALAYIDLQEPGVLANHSCSPNAGIRHDKFLMALADILPDQEILYDYSTTMDEDYWTLECTCGNQNCRGVVKDFKCLAPDLQRHYLRLGIVQNFIAQQVL